MDVAMFAYVLGGLTGRGVEGWPPCSSRSRSVLERDLKVSAAGIQFAEACFDQC